MRKVNKVCMYKFVCLVVCFWYFGQMAAWSLSGSGRLREVNTHNLRTKPKFGDATTGFPAK